MLQPDKGWKPVAEGDPVRLEDPGGLGRERALIGATGGSSCPTVAGMGRAHCDGGYSLAANAETWRW
jgi:hypothetical protein